LGSRKKYGFGSNVFTESIALEWGKNPEENGDRQDACPTVEEPAPSGDIFCAL
jgi:hypothetical protein